MESPLVVGKAADSGRCEHAVTGDHDRYGVGAAGLAHRARRGTQLARELTVAAGTARADRGDLPPHAAPKRRAFSCQRDVETEFGIFEITFELPASAFA